MVDERTYEDREVDVLIPEDDELPPWYIAPGRYIFRSYEAILKENKAGDGDYIEIGLETRDGDRAVEIPARFSLKRRAIWKLKDVLEAMGLQSRGSLKLSLDTLVDKWIEADVEDKTYNNRLGSEIKDVYPLKGTPPEWTDIEEGRKSIREEDSLGLDLEDDDLPF